MYLQQPLTTSPWGRCKRSSRRRRRIPGLIQALRHRLFKVTTKWNVVCNVLISKYHFVATIIATNDTLLKITKSNHLKNITTFSLLYGISYFTKIARRKTCLIKRLGIGIRREIIRIGISCKEQPIAVGNVQNT